MSPRKSKPRSSKAKGKSAGKRSAGKRSGSTSSGGGGGSSRGSGLTLDFASKLAAAGLVSKAEADAAAKQKQAAAPKPQTKPKPKAKANPGPASAKGSPGPGGLAAELRRLQGAGKAERYDTIRRWFERSRLDSAGTIPAENTEPFHFTTAHGQLARLYLDPKVRAQVVDGRAGIVAHMSNHGLAHGVLPRDLAEAVHKLFPLWLRVLKDHEGAGKYDESTR